MCVTIALLYDITYFLSKFSSRMHIMLMISYNIVHYKTLKAKGTLTLKLFKIVLKGHCKTTITFLLFSVFSFFDT